MSYCTAPTILCLLASLLPLSLNVGAQCPGPIANADFSAGSLSGWTRFRIDIPGRPAGLDFRYRNNTMVPLGCVPAADGHAAGTADGTNQSGWFSGIYQVVTVTPRATYELRADGQIVSYAEHSGDDYLALFWVNGTSTSFTSLFPGPARLMGQTFSSTNTWRPLSGTFTPSTSQIIIGAVVNFNDPSFAYSANSSLVDNFCLIQTSPPPATPTPTNTPTDCGGQTLINPYPNYNNGDLDSSASWGPLVTVLGSHTPNYQTEDRQAGNLCWDMGHPDGSGEYEFNMYHEQTFTVSGVMDIKLTGWIKAWAGWWNQENFGWNTRVRMELWVDGSRLAYAEANNTPGRWNTWLFETVQVSSQTVNSSVGVRLRAISTKVDVGGVMRAPIYSLCNFDDIRLEICLRSGGATPTPVGPDADRDGVPNANEGLNNTLPAGSSNWLLSDSDGDGRSDGQEDANKNGVRDTGETSTRNRDTDGDNFEDGIEILMSQDPLVANAGYLDSDGDGLPNSIDPNNTLKDTDGDRYDDGYDKLYGDPSNAAVVPHLGDVNGDTFVTSLDALIVQSLFLEIITYEAVVFDQGGPDYDGFRYSDVNRDGFYTSLDALVIQSYFLQILPLLPLR